MIFICFSGEERYSIVNNIIYHLENFNIKYWYDNYNLILGDNKRKEIFENGIKKSEYSIIIYSQNFFNHPSSIEEERFILDLHRNNKIKIFPILYKIKLSELPITTSQYLENIIYNEIEDSTNLYLTVNQILISILKDKYNLLNNLKFKFKENYSNNLKDKFLKEEFIFLENIDEKELNHKIIILKIIFDYLFFIKKIIKENDCEYKIFNYLIKKINYNLTYDFKELELMSIIINHYIDELINS